MKTRPSISSETASFIDDTTLWEVFLSKIGLNPLASQLMLGMLKRKTAAPDGAWGLRKLVCMSEVEREEMFGGLLGRRCLERVTRGFERAL